MQSQKDAGFAPSDKAIDFEPLFSQRAKRMKASEVRELLKLIQKQEIISFAGGLPNPEAFPVDKINEIVCDLLRTIPNKVLQYESTEGTPMLREVLAERLKRVWGIDGDKDNMVITAGSQQALDLLGNIIIDAGSSIILEAPTYLAAINAFRLYEPSITSIPLDDDGMQVDKMEEALDDMRRWGVHPRFFYVIPTFNNPAGVCLSLSRRKKVLDLAHEYDFIIIEDDPYGELRYSGEALPPLKALDKEDRVVYLGTFSKTLAPGFRIAWAFGPKAIVRKMVVAKQAVDLCSPTFNQYIAAEYLKRGYIDQHLKNIIALYGRKQRLMLKSMDEFIPKEYVRWTRPDGGMFLWATLDRSVDTAQMFPAAIAQNVAYVTGQPFFADGSGKNSMRLNFTYPSDDNIVEGVRRLANVIKTFNDERLKAGPGPGVATPKAK